MSQTEIPWPHTTELSSASPDVPPAPAWIPPGPGAPSPAQQSASYWTALGQTSPFPLFYDSCAKVYPTNAHRIVVYADAGGGPAECNGYPPDRHRYAIHAITRTGGGAAAAKAQIVDYEWGLFAYEQQGQTRDWAETRAAHGERYITYCPRALLHTLRVELGNCLWQNPLHKLWIPTLDGHQWDPDELSLNILRGWSLNVPPAMIWANQWSQGGPRGTGELEWDESSLFDAW